MNSDELFAQLRMIDPRAQRVVRMPRDRTEEEWREIGKLTQDMSERGRSWYMKLEAPAKAAK